MKKLLSTIILTSLVIISFSSCEEDEDDNIDIAAELSGVWIFNETQGDFAPQTYTVTITRLNETEIEIFNFYNLGGSTSVTAFLDGGGISIPTQSEMGNIIFGSARYTDAFNRMSLDFSVDDGASIDNVIASGQKQ